MAASGAAAEVLRLIAGDPWRMAVLRAVRALDLPDCWVGAGFVRAVVWDFLHGHDRPTPLDDVDVIYFDAGKIDEAEDRRHEDRLAALWLADQPTVPRPVVPGPVVPWSVKNQARMHRRNGDAPYRGTSDALCHWLETPTAVAVRMTGDDRLELLAPLGLDDLFAMRVAPTPHARARRMAAYRDRVLSKPWAQQWPRIEIDLPDVN